LEKDAAYWIDKLKLEPHPEAASTAKPTVPI
jgi:hypothetical protein